MEEESPKKRQRGSGHPPLVVWRVFFFGCCLPVENVFPGNYSGNTVDRARKQLMKLILLL